MARVGRRFRQNQNVPSDVDARRMSVENRSVAVKLPQVVLGRAAERSQCDIQRTRRMLRGKDKVVLFGHHVMGSSW